MRTWIVIGALALTACVRVRVSTSSSAARWEPSVDEQTSGTTSLLQAVSPVNDSVVWVSGHRATWARSTDGGATWQSGRMTGADSTLQFRDVHAVSATTAYLLSAGNGAASRIYKTTDAGASWQLQFLNRDSAAFYDCFDFWDADHGIAVSDAVRGRLIVIATEDGGAHWTDASAGLPAALEGEGAFAASGTCLVTRGRSDAWIGSAGAAGSRVYRTRDRGRSWTMATVPVVTGSATGVASVAFHSDRVGLAAGGAMGNADDRGDNVARTTDGGRTWTTATRTSFSGAVYGAAAVPGLGTTAVAAGPKGLDYTMDGGETWVSINANAYWAVGMASPRAGWAVGPRGRITRIRFTRVP